MLKAIFAGFAATTLVACSVQRPVLIDMGEQNTLRGVSSGIFSGEMGFTATNLDSTMSCTGSFPSYLSSLVRGVMKCSNDQKGNFMLNSYVVDDKRQWRGEGKLSNGQMFKIYINYLDDSDNR